MGTARSRTAAAGLATVLLAAAGCGGGSHHASAFGWLRPGPPPGGWRAAQIPNGAVLAYPPSWRRVHGDRGTATAVSLDPGGHIVGYLNVTPRQGYETPANWARFRPDHNGEEGERSVRTLASASGLKFRTGRGTCVKDSYTTTTGARYVEVACLVGGGRTSAVVVGASTSALWARISPVLERSISAFAA